MYASVSLTPSALTSAQSTDAPSAANRMAVARPMPPAAPVTMATLPSYRRPSDESLNGLARSTTLPPDPRTETGSILARQRRAGRIVGGASDAAPSTAIGERADPMLGRS